jgi:hypothetical protein
MRLTKTTLAVEIAVLLGIFVGVEWLAHVLTNTRDNFVFALLFWGVYLGIRMATSARKAPAESGRRR